MTENMTENDDLLQNIPDKYKFYSYLSENKDDFRKLVDKYIMKIYIRYPNNQIGFILVWTRKSASIYYTFRKKDK